MKEIEINEEKLKNALRIDDTELWTVKHNKEYEKEPPIIDEEKLRLLKGKIYVSINIPSIKEEISELEYVIINGQRFDKHIGTREIGMPETGCMFMMP